MTSYRVIARPGEAEVEARRSRFLCTLERVESEADARAVVERLRKQHWDARHTCSALILGPDGGIERSSDDGEPSGTAGAPMLEVLRGRGVSDVVAVVTRWFGGTLLGAGGLVRAYSDAVRAALDEVGTTERHLLRSFELAVPHADAGRLENDLRGRGVMVLGTEYDALARLRIAVPASDAARLHAMLAELSAGSVSATATGDLWADVTA